VEQHIPSDGDSLGDFVPNPVSLAHVIVPEEHSRVTLRFQFLAFVFRNMYKSITPEDAHMSQR
jgi:hypothetical protein